MFRRTLGFGVPYFNTFFLKEPLWKKSLDFFLPGYLKAKDRVPSKTLKPKTRNPKPEAGNPKTLNPKPESITGLSHKTAPSVFFCFQVGSWSKCSRSSALHPTWAQKVIPFLFVRVI